MSKFEWFDCDCSEAEHAIRVVVDADHQWPYVQIEMRLRSYMPWWKRIWAAIKYVVGRGCPYGEYDAIILNPAEVQRLVMLLSKMPPAPTITVSDSKLTTACEAKVSVEYNHS